MRPLAAFHHSIASGCLSSPELQRKKTKNGRIVDLGGANTDTGGPPVDRPICCRVEITVCTTTHNSKTRARRYGCPELNWSPPPSPGPAQVAFSSVIPRHTSKKQKPYARKRLTYGTRCRPASFFADQTCCLHAWERARIGRWVWAHAHALAHLSRFALHLSAIARSPATATWSKPFLVSVTMTKNGTSGTGNSRPSFSINLTKNMKCKKGRMRREPRTVRSALWLTIGMHAIANANASGSRVLLASAVCTRVPIRTPVTVFY